MAEEIEEDGYRWEGGYEKTWEVIKEDEAGLLDQSVAQLVARSKRSRLQQQRPSVKLGIMRHLLLVVDVSDAMQLQDLKPSRLTCTKKILEEFIHEYFDQNPISQLGFVITRNKRAEVLCDLSANPSKLVESLTRLEDSWCCGEPSLQNSLQLCSSALRSMPAHTSREVLVLIASLTTCDPGNINDIIQDVSKDKIRCSVIGLAAELRVLRHLAVETGGEYAVCLDDVHYRDLTMVHVRPPPAVAVTDAALIRIGFPSLNSSDSSPGKLSFCMCHLNTPRVRCGPDRGGFLCPQCDSKFCELPVECSSCGLTLMSAPHLARSYRHLLPLQPFSQLPEEQPVAGRQCSACSCQLKEKQVSQCGKCSDLFCLDCDLFVHETLHVCPGCSKRPSLDSKPTTQ